MITKNDIETLPGTSVIDSDGAKVGDVGQVYVSDDGSEPLFVTVKTGLFGTKQSFIPVQGATMTQDGLQVGFDKQVIKDAPRIDADQQISEDEQSTLFDYYEQRSGGRDGSTTRTDRTDRSDRTDRTDTVGTDRRDTVTGSGVGTTGATGTARGDDARGTVGHDTSGPTTDDAMTLSEERLKTGTQRVEAGRARLRKHIVTEQKTVTVPVSHDEVRLEREPITDGNRGAALAGPDLSEEEHEVVLNAERPVVETETVPVERVRLNTETVTEQQQVTQDVRHEEVDTDGVDGRGTDGTRR